MTPDQQIRAIYDDLRSRLPVPIVERLTFKQPSILAKQGSKILRGQILPLRTKSVFDSTVCFYEVGVGSYSRRGAAGVGFVCFPRSKKCGSGNHEATVRNLIRNYKAAHPSFDDTSENDSAVVLFNYYPATPSPTTAAADLAPLIEATFPTLIGLPVEK